MHLNVINHFVAAWSGSSLSASIRVPTPKSSEECAARRLASAPSESFFITALERTGLADAAQARRVVGSSPTGGCELKRTARRKPQRRYGKCNDFAVSATRMEAKGYLEAVTATTLWKAQRRCNNRNKHLTRDSEPSAHPGHADGDGQPQGLRITVVVLLQGGAHPPDMKARGHLPASGWRKCQGEAAITIGR